LNSGYLHRKYAESFAEIGEPIYLLGCGGWLIKRRIGDLERYDAMGLYPIFTCKDWHKLKDDIDDLSKDLISLSLMIDAAAAISFDELKKIFPDKIILFKKHFLVDFRQDWQYTISSHHRVISGKRGKQRMQKNAAIRLTILSNGFRCIIY